MGSRRTAAELMTPAIPKARSTDAAGDVLARLAAAPVDEASHVYLVDEQGLLVGQAPIERLLAVDPATPVGELGGDPPIEVRPGDPAEAAALLAVERHESDVAVVDAHRRLLGAIPIGALLALLHAEHVDDRLRAGGVGVAHPSPREADGVGGAIRARLPWLAIGLLGGSMTAAMVRSFESVIEQELAIAFFLPLVVYTADAVGTQTETVLVRALAYGPVAVVSQLRREARIGLLMGIAIGLGATALLAVLRVPPTIAVVVGLSLSATSLEATLVASLLPLGLRRIGADPALGSGPIATVIQDLLSVVIYLSIASAMLGTLTTR